jgi:Sulfotransferase domain.
VELLTLRVATEPGALTWSAVQRRTAAGPPAIPGLLARWWRAGPRAVVGRYLFADAESLQHFRFDPTGDDAVGLFDAIGQTTERTETIPADVVDSAFDRPVFILSAPRSGSTLLHDLIAAANPMWSIDGELQTIVDGIPSLSTAGRGYVSQVLDDTDADPATAATIRACLLAELRSADGSRYLENPRADRPGRVRLIEKCPEDALRIPFLRHVFPDARFIFLQRDHRQTISSMVEAWQHPGFVAYPELSGWPRGHWCFLLPEGWQRRTDATLTEIASFQWSAASRAILHALDATPDDQWILVDFADLVASPAQEVQRACEFIGAEPSADLSSLLARPLPLSTTTISAPSPIKWKSNRNFDPAAVKGLQPLAGTLRSLRARAAPAVARADQATTTRFACFVDELAIDETPPDAIVAPSLTPQLGAGVPPSLLPRARHRERFLPEHPLLWIEDPAFGGLTPLWLRTEQAWLCRILKPNAAPPPALSRELRGQLTTAGVLVSPASVDQRRIDGAQLAHAARHELRRESLCELPGLLDPVLVRAAGRYYNAIIESGEWPIGDAQVERRHGWHNERFAQYLHDQLVTVASTVAGKPLKPAYAYASAYRGSATLGAHLDREQCDYTVSIMIDEVSPTVGGEWPLWFETPSGRRSVCLSVGGAAMFRGNELPHWREPASPDHQQINLLFHFVPADWRGVLD